MCSQATKGAARCQALTSSTRHLKLHSRFLRTGEPNKSRAHFSTF